MKALVGAFNQEKALVGAFSVIVQPVVEPMDRFAALVLENVPDLGVWGVQPVPLAQEGGGLQPGAADHVGSVGRILLTCSTIRLTFY